MSLTAPAGAHTTLKVSPARPSALLLAVAFACEPAPSAPCGGRCGPGTVCEADQCVAAPVAAEPAPEATPTKKRGRRRKSGTGAPAAGEPEDPAGGAPEEAPPPPFVAVDDSRIPEFSAEQSQTIDLEAGSERPSEAVLDKHFARITPRIHDCVVTASRYGEVGRGRLAVKLRLLPSGKVESVSVKAPASLQVWGIVPCARKAVYDHRFPSYDGPSVGVDFGVDVD